MMRVKRVRLPHYPHAGDTLEGSIERWWSGSSEVEDRDRLLAELATLRRKAAAWDRLCALSGSPTWGPNVNQVRWFRGLLHRAQEEADHA